MIVNLSICWVFVVNLLRVFGTKYEFHRQIVLISVVTVFHIAHYFVWNCVKMQYFIR